ncbi:MAG: LptF/LptG family permease, partial [Chlamydiae bacterium]|nr:LptF/LptG family permease [Chlamydiota bacterium]
MKIWVRYLSSQLLQTFCFFLFAFFLLYILIDFSTHMQDFFVEKTLSFTKLSTYYLLQLLKRLLFLLPLALLVATIRVLTSLQVHRELIALQASGIHLKKILQPFFLLAIFCSFLGYANEEFLTPQALSFLELTQKTGKKDSLHKGPKRQFTILNLNDSSKLIYQKIDKEKNAFFDVYWVRSFNDIWKMKYLSTCPESPLGTYVDHITRNEQGFLEKQESFSQLLLPALHWETQLLHKKQSSTRYQKPSELISLLCSP